MVVVAFPLVKLAGLFAQQVSKPFAKLLKNFAAEHPAVRTKCAVIGQRLHVLSVRILRHSDGKEAERTLLKPRYYRLALPLPGDSEAFAPVNPTRLPDGKLRNGTLVSVLQEASTGGQHWALVQWTKNTEPHKAWIIGSSGVLGVAPLPEAKAVSAGAEFVSEAFIFGVATVVVTEEYFRLRAAAVQEEREIEAMRDLKYQKRIDSQFNRQAQVQVQLDSLGTQVSELKLRSNELDIIATEADRQLHGAALTVFGAWSVAAACLLVGNLAFS